MDVRSQVAMVFHLDKCIGCHTCSIACKNVWTDRKGAEYMWWNNVETKPGTGYPTRWEDQSRYRGGFAKKGKELVLRAVGRVRGALTVFHNPNLPTIDDYYEPFTYSYEDLFNAPEGADQPVAKPVSMITGEPMEIEAGPNWDDDLGGSPVYAANDPNLDAVSPEERQALFDVERLVFFYLPRICNHCLNPACVAACPSSALYKRGEDGIVLLNQERCRAWRFCVTGCPYKKTYFNWSTGKSEKCILCYPRLETGQAPACFHSCVGRIRYLGVLLYDADRIRETLDVDDADLVDAHRNLILDPNDPAVIEGARKNGIPDDVPRVGPAVAGLQVRRGLGPGPAAAPGAPDPPDALLRAPLAARDGATGAGWLRHRAGGERLGHRGGLPRIGGRVPAAAAVHGEPVRGGQRGPGSLRPPQAARHPAAPPERDGR